VHEEILVFQSRLGQHRGAQRTTVCTDAGAPRLTFLRALTRTLKPVPPLPVEVDADVTGGTTPVAVPGLPWRLVGLPARVGFDGAAPAIGVGEGVGLIAVGAVEAGPTTTTGIVIVGVVDAGCGVAEVGSVDVGSVEVEVGSVDVDVGSVEVGSVDVEVGSVDVGSVAVGSVVVGAGVVTGVLTVVGSATVAGGCAGKPALSGAAISWLVGESSGAWRGVAPVLGVSPV
jgi:hypothetical protein